MTANKMPPNPTPSYQSDQPARANKMPEMPRWDTACMECGWSLSEKGIADYGRACYLAALEDAKACVPDEIHERGPAEKHWNACRDTTLANLSALEQGVGK